MAVFGRKDYQQWRVVARLVRDLDLAVDVVGAPIAREADGLAMSSRNVRLTREHRAAAVAIPTTLGRAKSAAEGGALVDAKALLGSVREALAACGGEVDYAELVKAEGLAPLEEGAPLTGMPPLLLAVAVKFGTVRLIDNVEITPPKGEDAAGSGGGGCSLM